MAETRRRFDPQFREGAVRIGRETGKSIAQVARDLGISDGTLANWVKKDREARGEAAAGGLSEDERAELAQLRRENAELAMERDDASSDPWSGGSRKRPAGERGRLHRFPEGRT